MICKQCKGGTVSTQVLPRHVEDLGGFKVVIIDSVTRYTCAGCGETQTEIPAMRRLVQTAVVARTLNATPLSANELRFVRKSANFTQDEWAKIVGLRVSTIAACEDRTASLSGFSDSHYRNAILRQFGVDVLSDDAKRRRYAATDVDPLPVRWVAKAKGQGSEGVWIVGDAVSVAGSA